MAEDPRDQAAEQADEAGDQQALEDSEAAVGSATSDAVSSDAESVIPDAVPVEEPQDLPLEPSEVSIDGIPIRRIARRFREDGAVEAGAELTTTVLGSLRELALPLGTLVAMLVIVITFRQILLPFILAVALVYLMEPVVAVIGRGAGNKRAVPRWLAVLIVYASFICLISASVVFVVPTFVAEIVRFAEEVPQIVAEFRTDRLPGMNRRVQDFLRSYLPVHGENEARGEQFDLAESAIASARKVAAAHAAAFGSARAHVAAAAAHRLEWRSEPAEGGEFTGTWVLVSEPQPVPDFTLDDALTSSGWVYGKSPQGLVIEPDANGALRVNLNDVALEVEEVSESSWVIRQKAGDAVPVRESSSVDIDAMFDLEQRVDEMVQNLVSTSTERLASVIQFAQKLVVGVVGAFVGVMLTLMVAGFISIDLPRVMAFLRSLVPRRMRGGYDVLLEQLDTGLAGVVRGQLLICFVNGTLTFIGLWILGIKFRVLLAVIAGILSLIPVFGTVLSTIPIVLIGLTHGLSEGLAALVWILGIHALEANLLNPKIIGSSAHIHPVIVIFALLAGESAYGLVGALLAVPTASILLTLFNFVRTRAWTQAEGLEPSS